MKRLYATIVGAAMILSVLFYARSQTRRPNPSQSPQTVTVAQPDQVELQRTVTTQQRLNRYFHSSVMSKLKNCWGRIKGKGTVQIKHMYGKSSQNRWVPNKLVITKSTLSRLESGIAQRCMQHAVIGTSFSVEALDGEARRYTLYWTWPVPFPSNEKELARVGGYELNCYICFDGRCKASFTGSDECDSSNKSCVSYGVCATGGPYPVGGGTIIQ
jgi:hypothetical protein